MKKFVCNDQNCNFEVTGQTDDEILRKVKDHGMKVHQLKNMDDNKIKSMIRNM